nr:hypothetical protein [Tanacetum cinerariifolium]
ESGFEQVEEDAHVTLTPVLDTKKSDDQYKVKEYSKKDKIGSKPDKKGKRGEAGKSQKQLQ